MRDGQDDELLFAYQSEDYLSKSFQGNTADFHVRELCWNEDGTANVRHLGGTANCRLNALLGNSRIPARNRFTHSGAVATDSYLDVATQEAGHGCAEVEAQEELPRPRKHHHEGPQDAQGRADAHLAKVCPVPCACSPGSVRRRRNAAAAGGGAAGPPCGGSGRGRQGIHACALSRTPGWRTGADTWSGSRR
jgi:hypothetical protein